MRKPRFREVKEEPQLVKARAGTQAQTGWLQCALMHLLCIKKLIYMSNAVCWLPTRLCVYYPLECQVLHWIRSFSLHHDRFFCAGGNGQGSIDEFSETAAICLNKALFSIPRILARRPSSQPVPPGASFPVVPACLYTGSWKAWQQPHPGVFLSRINKSPSELKRKITNESFVLKWGWEGGNSTILSVSTVTCWTLDHWNRRFWRLCSEALIGTKEIRLLNDWLCHVITGILWHVLISWCTVCNEVTLTCRDSCDFRGIKALISVLFYSK